MILKETKQKQKNGREAPLKKGFGGVLEDFFMILGDLKKNLVVSLKFWWFLERKKYSGGFWFGWL